MSTIPVVWFDAQKGYWDHALITAAMDGELWKAPLGYSFRHYVHDWAEAPVGGGVLVVPGGYARHRLDEVQGFIDRTFRDWILLLVVSDEENAFPWKRLRLPKHNMVWVQYPHPGKAEGADRFLGCGWPTGTREILKERRGANTFLWYFAGQNNNPQRQACKDVLFRRLREYADGFAYWTPGFSKGLPREQYLEELSGARLAPSPAAAHTADAFRTYEALEAGVLPVADGQSYRDPRGFNFWSFLFRQSVPFPLVWRWDEFEEDAERYSDYLTWLTDANRCWAWWQGEKRKLVHDLHLAVRRLSELPHEKTETLRDTLTVLIPTSCVPSNPSTSHIEETIASIRAYPELSDCEIIVMVDGLRPEHAVRRVEYEQYKRRLLDLCNFEYANVLPVVFEQHTHQAGMTRHCLGMVETPCLLFVEHDCPVMEPERGIDWRGICKAVLHRADCNMIRLHYDESIYPDHEHLMLDRCKDGSPFVHRIEGVPLIQTIQWSQRPHVAQTSWYRWVINQHFRKDSLTMIEDRMHSAVIVAYDEHGADGWKEYGTWIYAAGWPDRMKRSRHTDARQTDSKFEESFKF